MNLTSMPKKPKSLKIAVFGLLAQVGGQDPPRCLLTSPSQTPSGAGEKRGGIRVRKFMGQNHEARKTLDARETDLTWGGPCNNSHPPLPTTCQLQTMRYRMPFNRKFATA